MDELARDFNQEAGKGGDGSGDESDEFGVFDPNKHVSFDEKVRFAEQLKKATREQLTDIVNVLNVE